VGEAFGRFWEIRPDLTLKMVKGRLQMRKTKHGKK
tara:strand:+ start:300 stop:404 length:105 start_codon:yes stop_codon:yes gene_type:complete